MGVRAGDQRGPLKKLTAADEVWCELVLAGVGGKTIEEAKQRLSYDEFQLWVEYRKRHGPLWHGPRLEHGAALVAHTVASVAPRKKGARGPKFSDFLPQRAQASSGEPIDLETAMKTWR